MNLKVEYLEEIDVIFKMALGNKSGNQVGSIHEKKQRSKILWDYPFKATISSDFHSTFLGKWVGNKHIVYL